MKAYLMNLLSLFFISCLLTGCEGDKDDYISKYCPGSCTIIQGRLTTENGARPLADVNIALDWERHELYNSSTRKKAITKTDANGYYELRFLVRDDEQEDGVFKLKPTMNLDRFIQCGSSGIEFSFYRLKRDTTILANYELQERAFIEIELKNQKAMQPDDAFSTQYSFLFGKNGEQECKQVLNWTPMSSDTYGIHVAADQPVLLKTFKTKNGVKTEEETTLQLAPGEKVVHTISF